MGVHSTNVMEQVCGPDAVAGAGRRGGPDSRELWEGKLKCPLTFPGSPRTQHEGNKTT